MVTPSTPVPTTPRRPSVVIVDDDDAVRGSLLRLLSALGYAARGFASGADFLAEAPSLEIGCLVIDLLMPNEHGDAVVERLRQLRGDVPVIFISGTDDRATQERMAAAGVRASFAKPVDPRALVAEIRSVLATPGEG